MTRKHYSHLPQFLKYIITTTAFSVMLFFSGADKLFSLQTSNFPQEKSVKFTSSPQGMNLYTLESGRLKHLGTTPTSISITFRSEKSSKRIHCRKIGYKTQKILAKPTDNVINVNLEKKDIFRNPEEFSDSKHVELQKKINLALEDLIYSQNSKLVDETFEILGKAGLVEIAEFNYLRIDILLDDDFRREKLRAINRIADKNQRYNRLAEEGLNKGGGELLFISFLLIALLFIFAYLIPEGIPFIVGLLIGVVLKKTVKIAIIVIAFVIVLIIVGYFQVPSFGDMLNYAS